MRQVGLVLTVVVVSVAVAALGLVLWLRTYAPLDATRPFEPGAGVGAYVAPTLGSGGKPVFIPTYARPHVFTTRFVLANTGRFAVEVVGFENGRGQIKPVDLDPEPRIEARQTLAVNVKWQLDCAGRKNEVAVDALRVRYRYLSAFTRTQTVVLPFAVTLRCSGAPPASP
jgi:hypothetical protein